MLELNDFIEITAPKEDGIGQYNTYMDARRQINIVSSYCIQLDDGTNDGTIDFKIKVNKDLTTKLQFMKMDYFKWYKLEKYNWIKPYLTELYSDFVNNNKDNFKWFFRDKRKREYRK